MQRLRQRASTVYAQYLLLIHTRVYGWLNRPGFFYVIIGLLVVQSLWIALSAIYPQAFDENYHIGLIQLHATQWLPFFTEHIPGAELYGAIARDPSYLYHFVFSLPYRMLNNLGLSLEAIVIVLRVCNIAIFVAGLYVYRKVLDELGIARRMMHVVLLFFVLTPIMPLLAAQINYDNVIFLLTGLLFLYAIRYLKQLYIGNTYDATAFLWILFYTAVCSITKYTSLPLSVALVGILIGVSVWKYFRKDVRVRPGVVWPGKFVVSAFAASLIVLGGLAVERYGINVVQYGHPVPDCAKVLTVEQCKSYSPWARDHFYAQTHPKPSLLGVVVYPFVWIHRMVFETMFTVASHFNADGVTVRYIAAPPLTVANYTAWTIVLAGSALMIVYIRRMWRLVYLRWLLLAMVFYTFILFTKNFSMYMHTGEAMAIHGRYLIPVFPVLYAVFALVFAWWFERMRRPRAKTWLVILTLLLLVHGAGLIVWIYRSNPSWYWSANPDSFVYQVNHAAQNIIHRIIIP